MACMLMKRLGGAGRLEFSDDWSVGLDSLASQPQAIVALQQAIDKPKAPAPGSLVGVHVEAEFDR